MVCEKRCMKTEDRQTGQRAQPKKEHLVAAQGGRSNSARCMQCYRKRNYVRLPDVASKYIMPRHTYRPHSAILQPPLLPLKASASIYLP